MRPHLAADLDQRAGLARLLLLSRQGNFDVGMGQPARDRGGPCSAGGVY